MPYSLLQAPNGKYWVITTATGKKHSIQPMSKEQAMKHILAMRIHGY